MARLTGKTAWSRELPTASGKQPLKRSCPSARRFELPLGGLFLLPIRRRMPETLTYGSYEQHALGDDELDLGLSDASPRSE